MNRRDFSLICIKTEQITGKATPIVIGPHTFSRAERRLQTLVLRCDWLILTVCVYCDWPRVTTLKLKTAAKVKQLPEL